MPDPVRISNPSSLVDPTPFAYAHVATVAEGSQLVYLAGQVGQTRDGTVSDDFSVQAVQAFENVKACLRDAGATIRNIVHMTTYIVNYDAAVHRIFELHKIFLADEKGVYCPPGTVVPVPALALPQLKIEIQCVAAVGPNSALRLNPQKPPKVTETDVVVVGAGLSGLQAATDIQKAGLSCVVLEAKDRVGGKTQTVQVNNGTGVLDVGAAWINDQTQPKMWALFKQFGMEPIVQRMSGDEVFRDGKTTCNRIAWPGSPFCDQEQQEIFDRIAEDMDKDSKSIDLHDSTANSHIEDISVAEYFRRKGAHGQSFDLWRVWIRALTGTEPENIGLVYWLDYIKSGGGVESLLSDGPKGAQYLTNKRGNGTISTRLAANLRPGTVHLNSPVRRIIQTRDGVLVETAPGALFHCRKALISVPTPLYRHIDFSPSLPAEKQEYVSAVHLGPYCKCILLYSKPWWRELGLNGSFIDLQGPVAFSRDVSSDEDGMFALSTLIFGEYATRWMRLSAAQRTQAVKDQLADMVGEEHRTKVYETIQTIEKLWYRELWSEGAPCPMPAPGGIWPRLGNELRRPFGNLHFIGTETAIEWKGYMEGAVRSGERGARDVIDLLRDGRKESSWKL
ncbi:uncharacterized protein Z518_03127 [Rhinocladiella mackenziei CBS 650.93]|uniref:Amine oxidase n=1 Tax=Rhinocladiella mackenziei CBS 650.93 TaxID=1442369 RepID=A0A0D2IYP6_9EURO|nr:uncharacterized protein Z518_03127 [Rhinocladiella mackenziei CBS 650.93]KIX08471.1 hypothetical protein Z518_03127 [Rhinocladiella mackenziei CBS 650.93]